jgi:hypothetical protein
MTEVLRQSTAKKLIGLIRHLTRLERFHKVELALEGLAMQTLMAMMDSIQPHRITLKSRVVLESPKAHMSRQYLCRTSRPDKSRIIHEVFIRDGNWGNATRVSSRPLRHNKHLYSTETAKSAWSSGRTSIRHDSRPQCPGDGSRRRSRLRVWSTSHGSQNRR